MGVDRYSRIPLDHPRTDPLAGLYIGSFGPHGPELLLMQRGLLDGEEAVLATKVTGDPNVPAGTLSFRAKVSCSPLEAVCCRHACCQ